MLKNRLTLTAALEDLKGVDLVIEAVLEDMQIKQDILEKTRGRLPSGCDLRTNTSALPIYRDGRGLQDRSA